MRFPRLASAVASLCLLPAALAQSPTTTTLSVTAGGSPVSTVVGQTPVTLTATVTLAGGAAAAPPGQVVFCEVEAAPLGCTDIRLLSTVQMRSAGPVVFKFIPGAGTHTYQARFLGTHLLAASSSAAATLSVTLSLLPTATTLSASGVPGNYTLASTVTNTDGAVPLSGTVSYADLSNLGVIIATSPVYPFTGSGLTFASAAPLPATVSCSVALAVADFNGDGKQDIATSDCPNETPIVSVLLGNGNATFRATGSAPSYLAAFSPAIAVADFNQDGKPDLAAAMNSAVEFGGSGNPAADGVQMLLGNGDGTFTAGPTTQVPSPQAIATGDFNGDGIADLAVTNVFNDNIHPPSINTVSILLGNGDGTFTLKSTMPTGVNPLSIAVADFNLDGKADLAIANETDNTVTVLLGNGDGTFTAAPTPTTGVQPLSIVAADFNGDGIPDLAVANDLTVNGTFVPGSVTILLGNGNGTFTPAGTSPATGLSPNSIAVGDFNGDGKADLTTANAGYFPPALNTASFLIGNGDGTFAPAVNASLALGSSPEAAATADLNGSGVSDLVSSAVGDISVILPQSGSVALASAIGVNPLGSGPHAVEAKYSGDNNNAPSVSSVVYLTAEKASPTLTLSINPTSLAYGQQAVLTVTIGAIQGYGPTGTLAIAYQGIGSSVTLPPTNTTTTFTFNILAQPAGTFAITATYSGDTNYLPATGSLTITVTPALTTAALVSSLNPANALQTVSFTATISGVSLSGLPPSGSVSFSDGATMLGTVPLVAGSAGASTAAFSTSTLAVGAHTIHAAYVPAAGYGASAATLTETINPAPQDFTIALASPSITLQTYQTSTTAVTLVSQGGFADTLALTCGALPADATCTVTPSSAKLGANATMTASLYLATVTIPSRNAGNRPPASPFSLALLLSPFGLFAAVSARRRRMSGFSFLVIFICSVATLTLAGCGSLVYPLPSAQPGTYTIPITATGAATGRTHSAQLTLTITP